jgi:hypothetical protein
MCRLAGSTESAAVLVAGLVRAGAGGNDGDVPGGHIGCGADVAPTI